MEREEAEESREDSEQSREDWHQAGFAKSTNKVPRTEDQSTGLALITSVRPQKIRGLRWYW